MTGDIPEFEVYYVGSVYLSACSSLSREETIRRVNAEYSSDVRQWSVSDKPFKTGDPNPCECNYNPQTHKHWLMVC